MSKPTIDAYICEGDKGPCYPVRIHVVPRVGELIDLYPLLAKSPVRVFYKVVKVTHEMHGLTAKVPGGKTGHHAVNIYVKVCEGESFPSDKPFPPVARN